MNRSVRMLVRTLTIPATLMVLALSSTFATEQTESSEVTDRLASGPISAIVYLVAVAGGLVAVLGVVLVARRVAGKSDIKVALSKDRQVTLKGISQGALIALIGGAIMLGAIRFFPKERSEIRSNSTKTTTTTIHAGPDSGTVMTTAE